MTQIIDVIARGIKTQAGNKRVFAAELEDDCALGSALSQKRRDATTTDQAQVRGPMPRSRGSIEVGNGRLLAPSYAEMALLKLFVESDLWQLLRPGEGLAMHGILSAAVVGLGAHSRCCRSLLGSRWEWSTCLPSAQSKASSGCIPATASGLAANGSEPGPANIPIYGSLISAIQAAAHHRHQSDHRW